MWNKLFTYGIGTGMLIIAGYPAAYLSTYYETHKKERLLKAFQQ